jgi:hypothetical protein
MPLHVVFALLYVTHAAAPHWLAFRHGAAQNWFAFASVKQQFPLPQLVRSPLQPW